MKRYFYILAISIISLTTTLAQERILDINAEVGSLPGGIAVSPTGAATYSIPIEIPAGRAGMTPALSLNYNSQAGNGLLGMGWNIGGLSAISRGGNTIYHDGQVEGIKFTSNDGFFLDGQRLILIAQGNWQDEYKTETESFSKIIAYHNGNNNPQRFKVWSKDGRILEYGFTENSSIEPIGHPVAYQWIVNNIKDRLGNYIEYVYEETGGAGLVKKIKYAGNNRTGALTDYEIEIFNINRDDINSVYIGGHEVEQNKIIEKIEIKYGTTVLKTYTPEYQTGFYKQLIAINVTDQNGNTINPTVMEYFPEPELFTDIVHELGDVYDNWTEYFFDFTGDGITDLMQVDFGQDEVKLWKRENNNFGSEPYALGGVYPKCIDIIPGDYDGDGMMDFVQFSYDEDGAIILHFSINLGGGGFHILNPISFGIVDDSWDNKNYAYRTGDVNGNGKTDFILVYRPYDNEDESYINIIELNDANDTPQVITSHHRPYPRLYDKLHVADFDGNGKSDIMTFDKNNNRPCLIYSIHQAENPYLEGMFYGNYPNGWHQVFLGDFNGDGNVDILTVPETIPHFWRLSYFKNSYEGFQQLGVPPADIPNWQVDKDFFDISIADYNGDSKMDILTKNHHQVLVEVPSFMHCYTKYRTFFSKGKEFTDCSEDDIYTIDFGILNFQNGEVQFLQANMPSINSFVDLNGDGINDVYIRSMNEDYATRELFIQSKNKSNKVKSFTNGFNNKTSISYEPLTNNDVYTKGYGTQYPLMDLQAAIYVVDKVTPDEDFGTNIETTYHYRGARIHKKGKGFLGFQRVEATNNLTNTVAQTNYGLFTQTIEDEELYFMPFPQIIRQYSMNNGIKDEVLSETRVVMDAIQTQEVSDLIFLPVTSSSITYLFDSDEDHTFLKTSKTEQPIDQIDDYGNSLKSYSGVSAIWRSQNQAAIEFEYSTTVENKYQDNIDADNWLISRPDWSMSTTKDSKNLGNDEINRTEFEYYNQTWDKGFSLPKKITSKPVANPGGDVSYYDSFTTTKEIEYDHYGHVTRETVSAPLANPSLEPITTEYLYDDFDEYNSGYGQRFLTKIITPSPGDDYVKQFVYNPVSGLVEKEISPTGLITSYEYGAFNRLLKTVYPDNTYVEEGVNWTGNTTGQLYYSQASNQNGATGYTYFDEFGRTLKNTVPHYWKHKHSFTEYNEKGQVSRVSTPWIQDEGELQWTEYEYDEFGRPYQTTLPTGNILFKEFDGFTTHTTNNATGITKHETVDVLGRPVEVEDPTGFVKYYYFSSGNLKEVEAAGIRTKMEYDPIGNQIELDEPNAGLNTYVYDVYGRLTDQTDGKGNHYKMEYDMMGRIKQRKLVLGNEVTNYLYIDDKSENGFGQLRQTDLNDIVYTYDFDNFGRTLTETQNFSGNTYRSEYTYDADGNVETYTYPGGLRLAYDYYSDGSLDAVKEATTDETLWQVSSLHSKGGQIYNTRLGNGLRTFKNYDDFGFLIGISAGNIQNLRYYWDCSTGNLTSRRDNILSNTEAFTYDNKLQSRLKSWEVQGLERYEIDYYDNGNIETKSDVTRSELPFSKYTYGNNAGPHAMTMVVQAQSSYYQSTNRNNISYTPFNKTSRIYQYEGPEESSVYEIDYGPDRVRKVSRLIIDKDISTTKHYIGNYEVEIDADGNRREINYISATGGLFAVFVVSREEVKMLYVHKDHLGSLYCLTDEAGNIAQDDSGNQMYFSFDPWGRRRNPFTWGFENITATLPFERGFTGHEHLDHFGLINMNGRTYDPYLGRMLQTDNYVQAAGYMQNYNRYSYALNNPLKYTDPDGEFVAIASIGLFFVGGSIHNLTNGVDNPFGTAWKDANTAMNEINSVLQFPVYSDNNTNVSVGISPFVGGVTVNVTQTNGNYTSSASGGFGAGGWYYGGGVTYHNNDIVIGVNAGAGNNLVGVGVSATYNGYGGGYTFTHYGNDIGPDGTPNIQNVGGVQIYLNDVSIRLENDFLGDKHDRWRSFGVEIGYKQFSIGTYLYNNLKEDGDKVIYDEYFHTNGEERFGMWDNGQTYISPLYFGFRYGNNLDRIGYNHPIFQHLTQNKMAHEHGFLRIFRFGYANYFMDYDYFEKGWYKYSGWDNPYSLWGR